MKRAFGVKQMFFLVSQVLSFRQKQNYQKCSRHNLQTPVFPALTVSGQIRSQLNLNLQWRWITKKCPKETFTFYQLELKSYQELSLI